MGIISSLKISQNLSVKLAWDVRIVGLCVCVGVVFIGKFLSTDSISVVVTVLFWLCIVVTYAFLVCSVCTYIHIFTLNVVYLAPLSFFLIHISRVLSILFDLSKTFLLLFSVRFLFPLLLHLFPSFSYSLVWFCCFSNFLCCTYYLLILSLSSFLI